MRCTPFILILSVAVMAMTGCVSTGTYKAKEQESLQLGKSLEDSKSAYSELQAKNSRLSEEVEALQAKLNKLDTEIAEYKLDNEKLRLDNGKFSLENEKFKQDIENFKHDIEALTLAVKPENLLKTLAESFANLQAENVKLKQALSTTEKISTKKESESPVQLNPVVAKPLATAGDNNVGTKKESSGVVKESVDSPAVIPEELIQQRSEPPRAASTEDKLPNGRPVQVK